MIEIDKEICEQAIAFVTAVDCEDEELIIDSRYLPTLGWLKFKESDYLLTSVMSKALAFVSDVKLETKVIKEFNKFIERQ